MKGIVLPWSGVVKEGCIGLKYNGGLYTQCGGSVEESVEESVICRKCMSSMKKRGELMYGSVNERLKCGVMEYKDGTGRSPVHYSKVMKKNGWSREDVEKEGLRLGVKVLECHLEERVVKRGRPRKEKVEVEKKSRGRPRKEKEVVSNEVGERLIASLLCGSSLEGSLKSIKETCIEDEEEEEIEVVKFELLGKVYLRSEENILFDIESHDGIGVWNELEERIEVRRKLKEGQKNRIEMM